MDLLTLFPAVVYPSTELIAENSIDAYIDGAGIQIRCCIIEARASAVYERFGVETSKPAILYTTGAYASGLQINATVESLGRRYRIITSATVKSGFGAADNASCALEGID